MSRIVKISPGPIEEIVKTDPETGNTSVTQWRSVELVYDDGFRRAFTDEWEKKEEDDGLGK